ncbi:MAG: hypothetical protein AB7N71_09880 [Phycisphaerae bacterium]
MILPIVLVIIGLLTLTMAGFVFFLRAETAGLTAHRDLQQARLAAESGLEEVIATLRVAKHDASQWYDVPNRFRHALVYAPTFDREKDPVRQSQPPTRNGIVGPGLTAPEAWRYAVCAPIFDPQLERFRYGITPESAKLNLNTATPQQLGALIAPLLTALEIENPGELIDAVIDWRDEDDDLSPNGAENDWYNTLTPPYSAKNGPFDTVEELLVVKGWNAIALYGEDVNRNGMLDPNEDDGDASWPFWDNADGTLNPGVAPFLTVSSREPDTTLSNKPRINLNGQAGAIAAQITAMFPDGELSSGSAAFITQLKSSNFDFSQLTSVAQLYIVGYVPPPGTIEGDAPPAPGTLPPNLLRNNPITAEELPLILDAFSLQNPQTVNQTGIVGLININAAPPQVLAIIPGITPDLVSSIVATRATLTPQDLRTPAWLVTSGLVDTITFHQIAPYVTTKAYQFHVEIVGYADHTKAAHRVEWIIEMIGPIA